MLRYFTALMYGIVCLSVLQSKTHEPSNDLIRMNQVVRGRRGQFTAPESLGCNFSEQLHETDGAARRKSSSWTVPVNVVVVLPPSARLPRLDLKPWDGPVTAGIPVARAPVRFSLNNERGWKQSVSGYMKPESTRCPPVGLWACWEALTHSFWGRPSFREGLFHCTLKNIMYSRILSAEAALRILWK